MKALVTFIAIAAVSVTGAGSATHRCREGWCDGLLLLNLECIMPHKCAGFSGYPVNQISVEISGASDHLVPIWTSQVVEEDCRKD